MFFAFLVVILIGFSLVSVFANGARRFRRQAVLVSEYAAKRGYRLLNPAVPENLSNSAIEMLRNPSLRSLAKGSEGIVDIEPFGRGKDDPLALVCTLRSRDVTVLNFTVSSQRADGAGGTIHYRVAKVRAEHLPRFALGPRSVVHSVENLVDGMIGRPSSTINLDPHVSSDFSKHYWLEAQDRDAVLAFLSPGKLAFIANEKLRGDVVTNSGYFVYRENGQLRSEDDFDSFVATVDKVIAHLL
jgi:hypothetical protein